MTSKQRWVIIGSVLFATLAAGYFAEDETPPEGKRMAKAAKQNTSEARRGSKDQQKGEPQAMPLSFPEPVVAKTEGEEAAGAEKIIDPFRNKSWFIPPPPPPVAKPVAPALPFQYLGKLIEDGETRVFLNHQGKHLIAKVGDVINGTYSVEAISGGQMTLIYQPLKEKQLLAIGIDK